MIDLSTLRSDAVAQVAGQVSDFCMALSATTLADHGLRVKFERLQIAAEILDTMCGGRKDVRPRKIRTMAKTSMGAFDARGYALHGAFEVKCEALSRFCEAAVLSDTQKRFFPCVSALAGEMRELTSLAAWACFNSAQYVSAARWFSHAAADCLMKDPQSVLALRLEHLCGDLASFSSHPGLWRRRVIAGLSASSGVGEPFRFGDGQMKTIEQPFILRL